MRRVGEALQALNYFDGTAAASVEVGRAGGGYYVAFILREGAWNDPEIVEDYRRIKRELSAKVFNGDPVEVRLCDSEWEVRRVLP